MDCSKSSKELLEALAVPFETKDIEWRVQSASRKNNVTKVLVVPYLNSRAVMNRLDDVCGAYWQSNFEKIIVGQQEAFQCRLSIKVENEWISRLDAAEVSDMESVKGGHSNSLKRAAVQWGIGRYLYDLPKYWVELKSSGQHRVYGKFKINNQQEQLQGYFDAPNLYQMNNSSGKTNTQFREGAQKPSQKEHPNTQQPTKRNKDKLNEDERRNSCIGFIKNYTNVLGLSDDYLKRIAKKALGSDIPYEKANLEDLKKLFNVLHPVFKFVQTCNQFNQDPINMLYYAQIPLKKELNNINQLYFELDLNKCQETIEYIKTDMEQQQAV
ncbi:Rad52/Rad22 family DNA repair protein [Cytobacillus purgationiresistens]|nr:Rad52/Rad22 family DNA repair protein [Cytobacillus purgationiresistens]